MADITIYHVMQDERREEYDNDSDTTLIASFQTFEDAREHAKTVLDRSRMDSYRYSTLDFDEDDINCPESDEEDDSSENNDSDQEDSSASASSNGSSPRAGESADTPGCYIRGIDGETHFKVWVEEGILHARKTRPVAVADDRIHAPVVAPMQYAIHIRHFYSNDGISFHRESWDPRGKVYTNLKEANEEARWMALEALARDEDEEELKDELEEINVGSSRKLYQGEAQLSPFLYNDPVSAAIRVVELKVNDPLAANHAVPTTANAGRQTKRPRYL